jgi:hypothetical protein
MEIKHQILEFTALTGSILVNYFCDEVPEGLTYNIDLPIENGQIASPEKVDELINLMAPRVQLERIIAMKTTEIPVYLAEKIPVVQQDPVVEL